MSKIIISDDLKQHMTISPKKERVWVNDAGEWSNHPDAKYPHELSRADILDGKAAPVKPLKVDAGAGVAEKNTTDAKLKVEVTKANKKGMPEGAKIGDIVEIDNPDYVDPLA